MILLTYVFISAMSALVYGLIAGVFLGLKAAEIVAGVAFVGVLFGLLFICGAAVGNEVEQ